MQKETADLEADKMFLHRLFSTVLLLGIFSTMIFAPMHWRSGVFYCVLIVMTALLIREITTSEKISRQQICPKKVDFSVAILQNSCTLPVLIIF